MLIYGYFSYCIYILFEKLFVNDFLEVLLFIIIVDLSWYGEVWFKYFFESILYLSYFVEFYKVNIEFWVILNDIFKMLYGEVG